jgi:GNAT superfamily N-acetyltransferase
LQIKGEALKIAYGVYLHVSHQFDPFQFYQVDVFLSAVGLTVHPDFRRRGIAVEILKARLPLCKAFGIKVTSTMFTAIGSQISATKAGFIENYSIE